MKKTLVMKFGGAAVETPAHFSHIANIVIGRYSEYERIAVVVSAMGNATDELLSLAKKVHPIPPQRELDMLLSVGERISISLLAMAISLQGKEVISFTGSQSGIITSSQHVDANIVAVRPGRVLQQLDKGTIVIVAGFQGVSKEGEITTLGRGGSDTTAVALGVALEADRVEFYKDVGGIFEEDPKVNPDATHFPILTYEEALKVIQKSGKVLHPRSIELAKRNALPLLVRSFQDALIEFPQETLIRDVMKTRSLEKFYELDFVQFLVGASSGSAS